MLKNWINKLIEKKGPAFVALGFGMIMLFIFLLAVFNLQIDANRAKNAEPNPYTTSYNPTQTAVGGDDVTIKQFKEDNEAVKQFVEFCNQKEFSKAYELLTNNCKDALYPDVDTFSRTYCAIVFKTEKLYSLQAWMNFDDYIIYKISYIDDVLATGNYTDGEKYNDFITVFKNDNNKIAINKYIKRQEIFKNSESAELEILVKTKDIFLDYESYTVDVTNRTENDILLDSMENADQHIILTLESGSQRGVNINSIRLVDVLVHPDTKKTIKFNFSNDFGTNYSGKRLDFKDILINRKVYYDGVEDTENNEYRISLTVNF